MMAGAGEPAPGREWGGDAEADAGADARARVLYVSGEESVEQLAARAERIRPSRRSMDHLLLLSCSQLDPVLDAIAEERPVAVVVDSIQTLYLQEASGSAGSTTQVRECATALLQVAKLCEQRCVGQGAILCHQTRPNRNTPLDLCDTPLDSDCSGDEGSGVLPRDADNLPWSVPGQAASPPAQLH